MPKADFCYGIPEYDRIDVFISSSEGGIGTTFSNWDAPWYLGSEFKKVAGQHEQHELLALIAPRPPHTRPATTGHWLCPGGHEGLICHA